MKEIKKYYLVPADPEMVYAALTREATIQLWTGAPAEMSPEAGTEFSMWEGNITGRNLEFEEGRKLVQQWYFEGEPPSVVTLVLHPHKKGTSVELRHTGIPDEYFENMQEGWDEIYFGSLMEFFEE